MQRDERLMRTDQDEGLQPFRGVLRDRMARVETRARQLLNGGIASLADFACAHEYYGLHQRDGGWVFREWAPNATAIGLVGDFSSWAVQDRFALQRVGDYGVWELRLPSDALRHGQYYRLEMAWDRERGERIPAYARRVCQDPETEIFSAQVWAPESPYVWRDEGFRVPDRAPLIYEAHVGMAQSEPGIGTFDAFREKVLPRVIDAGYNTLQLMAIMEHPYYASFGYQVSSYFAASSRFGTPESLKALVDAAHAAGLAVIMDLVHSHAVRNEREGLSRFDGSYALYFHAGSRGWHPTWDSRCFDYGRIDVLHFLLSNCRYWLDEFHFDGFRFDGVTSMLYLHHGLGVDFVDYRQYFDENVDEDAVAYLALANRVIHAIRPDALTIAEDVSGMPGLAAPAGQGGLGFDARMAMGGPECWRKLVRDVRDENWSIGYLWHSLTDRRRDEQTINYVECHDQALVGGKTLLFELADTAAYSAMHRAQADLRAERAVALHKMIRLATLLTAGHGYLNFMGNEFGHPEWIDFPREGNGFSFQHARRQWHLRDNSELRFHALGEFDRAMLAVLDAGQLLGRFPPRPVNVAEDDKVLALTRGPFLAIFNFHRDRSRRDYEVCAPSGAYALVLDTDQALFAGQGRIRPAQRFFTESRVVNREQRDVIRVYLPARTAVVLRREPPPPT